MIDAPKNKWLRDNKLFHSSGNCAVPDVYSLGIAPNVPGIACASVKGKRVNHNIKYCARTSLFWRRTSQADTHTCDQGTCDLNWRKTLTCREHRKREDNRRAPNRRTQQPPASNAARSSGRCCSHATISHSYMELHIQLERNDLIHLSQDHWLIAHVTGLEASPHPKAMTYHFFHRSSMSTFRCLEVRFVTFPECEVAVQHIVVSAAGLRVCQRRPSTIKAR
jgi:hypothetical protein